MKYLFLTISMIVTFSTSDQAQAPAQPSAKMKAATDLYNQKKYVESSAAFADVLKEEPQNGRAWYFMGMSFHSLGRYEQAIAAFEKNLGINAQNANAMYNIASGYSRLKQADKAFEWLDKALKTGPAVAFGAETDPDLENIRADARFAKFRDSLDRSRRPCMYSAESRQFDFWLGKWDVSTQQGQKVGVNVIESFADGCSLMENWTANNGSNGKSINYYDPTTQKWYQFWIGSGGGALRYSGGFKDGVLHYEAETIGAAGKKVLLRLTFSKTDENGVRQVSESSNDEGKTWTINYDFRYTKVK